MSTVQIEVPDELLELLRQSRLGTHELPDQLRIALAIQLLQEGVITAGKAASIAGEPRATFELLLADMGIPSLRYDVNDYRQDLEAFEQARQA